MQSFSHTLVSANTANVRYVIHQGGTRSGKTWAIAFYLLVYAAKYPGTCISVVSETYPHLKRGVMRDMKNIIENRCWAAYMWFNKTDHILYMTNNSFIEFFPADSDAKLRGAKRDILFINECNNVSKLSFDELDVRTSKKCILDFNPVKRFWVHDHLIPLLKEFQYKFVKSTYKDNPFLTADEIDNIERRKSNENWWRVYGEGEIGVNDGLIFTNWETVDNTDVGKLLGYGVDFGFTQSYTAIVQVNEQNGELYVKELLYKTNTTNEDILNTARAKLDLNAQAIADCNEPKTIEYLYRAGWYGLKGCIKGPDSVTYGLNLLLERKINIDKASVNLIKEFSNYMWDKNHDGENINRPIKANDHGIDAIRYLISAPPKPVLVFL